jgi:Fe-S cluster assembly protein SufD
MAEPIALAPLTGAILEAAVEARHRHSDEPAFLRDLRARALARYQARGLPTRRDEEWRFTDVAPIASTPFSPAPPPLNGAHPVRSTGLRYDGAAVITLVDGHVRETPEPMAGVRVLRLSEALREVPDVVESHLGRHAPFDNQPFTALATALMSDGVVVVVEPGAVVERPLQVLSLSTAGGPLATFPRVLLVAGRGSQVTLAERFAATGTGQYLTCPVTEIVAAEGAVVEHYKVQEDAWRAFHMSALMVALERDSAVSSHAISTGAAIARHDVGARLAGEGADCILNGLYLVTSDQHVDTHMRVEHAAPHCTSHELYKGILDERSSAVFSGRIFVHREAQQTDAVQANRNLLLSRQALVNSNPQLEIFADDVRCTHGSTTGQLDEEAVFYLRSRGIGDAAARSLLVYAFASDIVDRIKLPAVRKGVEDFLFERLPRGEVVRQAV